MEHESLVRRALDEIPEHEIPETLERLLAGQQDTATTELSLRLTRCLATGDPDSAAAWASHLAAGPFQIAAIEQVATVWANAELEAAAAWAQHLPETLRICAVTSIAREAVRRDPVKALQLAVGLPTGDARDSIILHASAEWTAASAENALAWARNITDESLRPQVLAAMATAWSERDPLAAATLVTTDVPPGAVQANAVISIVQRWAQQDPGQAARWVESFPEGDLRQTALENLAANRSFSTGR